ncbi:MAG TPA: peptidyl-prolyl cis-trans isomerase [Fimbriimonadales bacterium]|nr:peptidyl-prolyl cis-trans isomerase [Fimbriimonadales bacterium]
MTIQLFSFLAILLNSISSIQDSKVILRVNGVPIFASEYYKRMELLPGVGVYSNGKFVERPPAFLTILQIVQDQLILQLAKEQGVAPTENEINQELNNRKAQDNETYKAYADFGIGDEELKRQIAIDIAQFKLLTKGVTVTDQQVADHYNTNKLYYTTPATVKLRVIVVKNAADKQKVDNALKSKPFADVAKEMSTDITKYAGGDLPEVSIAQLPQNVLNEVTRTAPGKDTAWIESEGAFSKYRVEKKTEAKQLLLDDKLKERIRRMLMVEIGKRRNNVKQMLEEMRSKAKIEIASPGLQKLWDAYMRDYKMMSGG